MARLSGAGKPGGCSWPPLPAWPCRYRQADRLEGTEWAASASSRKPRGLLAHQPPEETHRQGR